MRLPALRGTDVVRALAKAGFVVIRRRGSHQVLRHQDRRTTVVPVHRGETLGPGMLSKILNDVQMTREEFQSLL